VTFIAHGLVARSDLPIPEWLFGWAAAMVLVVSFVALAILWPEPRLERERWRPLPGGIGRLLGSRVVEACAARSAGSCSAWSSTPGCAARRARPPTSRRPSFT
jgi:hypothetical protein